MRGDRRCSPPPMVGSIPPPVPFGRSRRYHPSRCRFWAGPGRYQRRSHARRMGCARRHCLASFGADRGRRGLFSARVLSFVNDGQPASAFGSARPQRTRSCCFSAQRPVSGDRLDVTEARRPAVDLPGVIMADSNSLVTDEDSDVIFVTGSHGGLLEVRRRPQSSLTSSRLSTMMRTAVLMKRDGRGFRRFRHAALLR